MSYGDVHAAYYDALYADKDYVGEAARVLALCERIMGRKPVRLLDVACGTGRHAQAFLSAGVEVVGVDASSAMVAQARHRLGPGVQILHGDMRDLAALQLGTFDAVVCLFDSLGFAQTNEGVLAALGHFCAALEPGGLLIIEVWHAAPMLSHSEPVRVRRVHSEGVELLRISETSIDVARQLATISYSLYELRPEGNWRVDREQQVNRFFLVEELRSLASSVGLRVIATHGGWDDRVVDTNTWHIVVCAERVN